MKITLSSVGGALVRLTAILLFFSFGAQQAVAATKAERIRACMSGQLSDVEKANLLSDMTEWKTVFSKFVEENVGPCYTALTGEAAEFINGQGLTVDAGLIEDVLENRKLDEIQIEEARIRKVQKQEIRLELINLSHCLDEKLLKIRDLHAAILKAYDDSNAKLISDRTYAACVELHARDANSAMLNDVCREVFQSNLHPDLDTGDMFELLAKLSDAADQIIPQIIEVKEKINELNGVTLDSQQSFAEAMDQALAPCG